MSTQDFQEQVGTNALAIDRLTSAVDVLVSQFIRPNAQQHLDSMERLDRIEQLLDRHAQAIVAIDLRLDRVAEQQRANVEQITQNTEGIAELRTMHRETQQSLQILIDEGRADRQAQQEALRVIISNAQRTDQLEQQAS